MSIYKSSSLAMIPTAYKDGKLYSVRPTPEFGSEKIINGSFDTDTAWTKGTGWTISGGTASCDGTQSSTTNLQNSAGNSLENGKTYRVIYTISNYVSGSIRVKAGNTGFGKYHSANGTYIQDLVAGVTTFPTAQFNADADFVGSIDNVSVKEITNSGDFDFSRGSNLAATRVASSGYIEKGRENLLLQSNAFDTTWVSSNTTETGGQSGYDGTSDAWLLTKSAAYANLNQSVSASGVNTYSLYAKANTLSWLRIVGGSTSAFFDLSNGVVGTTDAGNIAKMTSIGSGWYRCEVAMNASTTIMRIYPAQADNDVTGTSGSIYIQDAQLEAGLVATSVIETGATTAQAGILEDMPRLDYSDGATCPSLLLEPQRTNLLVHSEYIGATQWVNASATRDITITQTSEINPEGGAICWKIQGLASGNQLAYVNSTTSGTTLTNSIYVKRVSGTGNVLLRDVNNSSTSFSLSVADGWKRIDATATATSVTARFYLNLVDYTDEILVWGAQQEEGSYPTSYIPTYGASVTRSVDDVNEKTGVSELIGQSEGTLFLDFVANDEDALQIIYQVRTTGSSNVSQIDIRIQGGNLRALGNDAGTAQFNISAGAAVAGTRYKCAVRYANNDVAFYVNGVLKGSDTSASFSSSALQQVSFSENTGTFRPSASIHQAILFPTGLTNAELASLTTL